MSAATLVCRLSGPLQSWGEQSGFARRGTLAHPTYSGLLGLCRAALGHDRRGRDARSGQAADDSWLRAVDMWIRVDRPGTTLTDYHTVGPREGVETVPTGSGRPWRIKEAQGRMPQTLQTWRVYLTDAAFLWLITGPTQDIERLHEALATPFWQLSLGRKACVPDFPLVLGRTPRTPTECLDAVPVIGSSGARGAYRFTTGPLGATDRAYADWPLGPHPHDGYGYRWRETSRVTPPAVTHRTDLFSWAKENLT